MQEQEGNFPLTMVVIMYPKHAAKDVAQWAILLAAVHCWAERAGKPKF